MPSVLVVVGGGEGTLKTVVKALMKKPPLSVVVIVGSGRAADLLAYAYEIKKINDIYYDSKRSKLFKKVIKFLRESKNDSKEERNKTFKAVLYCMRMKRYVSK